MIWNVILYTLAFVGFVTVGTVLLVTFHDPLSPRSQAIVRGAATGASKAVVTLAVGLSPDQENTDWSDETCRFNSTGEWAHARDSNAVRVIGKPEDARHLLLYPNGHDNSLALQQIEWLRDHGLSYRRDYVLTVASRFEDGKWLSRFSTCFKAEHRETAMLYKLTFGGAA